MSIEGVTVNILKQIKHPKGDIYHALKASDPSFVSFGEAYFSTVINNEIKGWKKHLDMTMNLIVPVGCIKFVLLDDRKSSLTYGKFQEVSVSHDNYVRLTVPPSVWVAFKGGSAGLNLLLNIASIEHDPNESVTVDLNNFKYKWN